MRFLSVNLDSFLIELNSLEETLALYRQLQQLGHPDIREMIPAAQTILVYFDRWKIQAKVLMDWIAQQPVHDQTLDVGRERVVDVCYDGEDLAPLADQLGWSVTELIQRHTQSHWQVAFIGFAPGFAYLVSPEQQFQNIPRLSSPRKKVPVGSVALANDYTGIYPKDSPGGWQLIGRTTSRMWDELRDPPALLLPSDRVVFRDVTRQPTQVFLNESIAPKTVQTHQVSAENAVLKVLKVGLQTLIQDQGRDQVAKLGVGQAGAMDQTALASANALVGNTKTAAALEILNGGFSAEVLQPTVIAVTGGVGSLWVTYPDQSRVDVGCYRAIALDAGDRIEIAAPETGLRQYLALRGGIAAPLILGSRSYDSLAALGSPPVQVGELLAQADGENTAVQVEPLSIPTLPRVGDTVQLDIVLGPRTDWFSSESVDLLLKQTWQVSADSNRVGLRLQGQQALQRSQMQELPSEGTCTGALQVPPNGQPVLFMNDHPLTGGYPVIAAVAPHHLSLVAQIPAGCQIQFRQISE